MLLFNAKFSAVAFLSAMVCYFVLLLTRKVMYRTKRTYCDVNMFSSSYSYKVKKYMGRFQKRGGFCGGNFEKFLGST